MTKTKRRKMNRIYSNGDIQFKIDSTFGERFKITFFTNSTESTLTKTQNDVVEAGEEKYIFLNWSELNNLGGGVLNYILQNITDNLKLDDGTYDRIYSKTTDYYIVADSEGQKDSERLQQQLNKLIDRSITEFEMSDDVTTIGEHAFYHCEKLTSIKLSNNLKSIGQSAFHNCHWLRSIEFPDTLETIDGMAFALCGFTDITLPDSVREIGASAFYSEPNLRNITIGSGVTSIGAYAFSLNKGLLTLTVHAETPPVIGNTLIDSTSPCQIYVPSQSVDAYKTATNWSAYADRIQAIS